MHAVAAREQREQSTVFIVGMRRGVKEATRIAQVANGLNKTGVARVLRKRGQAFLDGLSARDYGEREDEEKSNGEATHWSHSSLRISDMNYALDRMQNGAPKKQKLARETL
jgi:hypothetical protein